MVARAIRLRSGWTRRAAVGIAVVAITLQQRLGTSGGYPAGAYGGTYWVIVGFSAIAALAALTLP